MPRPNQVGDLVLTDPAALRALADPARLALLDRLRREGPATAAELSSDEAALGELARFGLVAFDAREGRWAAVGKGFVFEIPEDPEGQAAARELSNVMFLSSVDVPRRWVADDEPRLELDRARAAGLLNARVRVTADELRNLQDALERLLEPLLTRDAGDLPEGAAPARILCYFMPEAG
jgi:DNA-binding transcriptional ArsR family regulator